MFSAGIILEIANLFRRHRGRSAIRETFPTRHFPRLRYVVTLLTATSGKSSPIQAASFGSSENSGGEG